MKQKLILNGLWFDNQAEDAANFYISLFAESTVDSVTRYGKEGFEIHQQPEGTAMAVDFTLSGQKFVAINGGPLFKFNPSISYFVACETTEEADKLWNKLADGGNVLMPYQKYEWSEKYGWVSDKYGLSWQIGVGKISDVGQKITPSLMFVGKQAGRAQEAIDFYISVFKNSSVKDVMKHPAGGQEPEGNIAHATFTLAGQTFMIMETANKENQHQFNEAISIIVNCDTQEEIDYYWEALTSGGGAESSCGWLKDKFGVSWQVYPTELGRMLKDTDKEKVGRVTNAFLKMKKFDLAKLRDAFNSPVPAL